MKLELIEPRFHSVAGLCRIAPPVRLELAVLREELMLAGFDAVSKLVALVQHAPGICTPDTNEGGRSFVWLAPGAPHQGWIPTVARSLGGRGRSAVGAQ